MEAIFDFFIYNEKVYKTTDFNKIYKELNPSIYEVIRLINGKPLFLEEHYERLKNSANLLGQKLNLELSVIKENIEKLAKINNIKDINVKIVINNFDNYNIYLYFIKSQYPTEEMYKNGVKTLIYKAERKNPHAKIIYKELREDINKKLKETECYEALLLNERDEITEGSRSNIFFIKDDKVYTSPSKDVLLGITRQKILKICKENNIEVIETPLKLSEIKNFNSCFLTGTSPKVLPIAKVNDIEYDVNNKTLRKIMNLYDEEIKNYLKNA